jgi:hypothetical protein
MDSLNKQPTLRKMVGKPEGKRPPGRSRHRWKDNTKMDLRMGWYGVGYSGSG